MSETDRSTFRRRLGDPVKADQDVVTTNGQDRTYLLRYDNVFDVEVYLDGVLQDDDNSVYTLDGMSGSITFITIPTVDKVLKVVYKFAAYTDAEADELIEQYGVDAAVIEALKGLLADSARLYAYQQGPTRAEQNQVFEQLLKLLETYQKDSTSFPSSGGNVKVGKRIHEAYSAQPVVIRDLSRDDDI